MHHRDEPGNDGRRLPAVSPASELARLRARELAPSHELLSLFFPGKQFCIGLARPYQFVATPEAHCLGCHVPDCPCPEHQGQDAVHILDATEVTLLIECGPERVWVFISIPARYRAKYAWLPTVELGGTLDAEVCGVLVARSA